MFLSLHSGRIWLLHCFLLALVSFPMHRLRQWPPSRMNTGCVYWAGVLCISLIIAWLAAFLTIPALPSGSHRSGKRPCNKPVAAQNLAKVCYGDDGDDEDNEEMKITQPKVH